MKNIVIIACCRSGHNFVRQMIESWFGRFKIINMEDLQPKDYKSRQPDFPADWSLETVNLIVVRDLLNWWASYLKWIPKPLTDEKRDLAFKIWTAQAKEAYTGHYLGRNILVSYETFCTSRPFRKLICHALWGDYNESMLDVVAPQGNGSSFDGFSRPGSKMKTHLRYREIMHTSLREAYNRGLRENPEAIETYKQFLPLTTDQENMIDYIIHA